MSDSLSAGAVVSLKDTMFQTSCVGCVGVVNVW